MRGHGQRRDAPAVWLIDLGAGVAERNYDVGVRLLRRPKERRGARVRGLADGCSGRGGSVGVGGARAGGCVAVADALAGSEWNEPSSKRASLLVSGHSRPPGKVPSADAEEALG